MMDPKSQTPIGELPEDYAERVYAGVLGKLIGVYLGRPFEGWTNERIERELGDITDYVHERLGQRLLVTDDDISGTLTFVRAFEDYGDSFDIAARDIGQSWLNYIIENRTILWWGGLGNSTEHTAYLRLQDGVEAPSSGSAATNGKVVSEQIGAQIFIDGWAMLCPGEPHRAAALAERAARVSHDGEAVYGARALAAMEALAFVERDADKLLDTALDVVPDDSVIAGLIRDVRRWHAENPDDWRHCFRQIQASYGYDRYGGGCHMVPNHGLIVMGLLYADGDFLEAMKVVNTAGWDTDCNSGNLACLMGILCGVEGLPQHLRNPVADRCYIPTADGGRAISDAVTEAVSLANMGRRARGLPAARGPAQFDFDMPGALQGFLSDRGNLGNIEYGGRRGLAIDVEGGETNVWRSVFVDSLATWQYFEKAGYALMATPRVNPGQTLFASVAAAGGGEFEARLRVLHFNAEDELQACLGDPVTIKADDAAEISWKIPDLGGYPISAVGLQIRSDGTARAVLRHLGWRGTPDVRLARTPGGGMWRNAWVNGLTSISSWWGPRIRLTQNRGTGLMLYGTREWRDYRLAADVTPHLARRVGIAARAQGMRRYYALLLNRDEQTLQLVRELDGTTVIAQTDFHWELGETYEMELRVFGDALEGRVGDVTLAGRDASLPSGGIALVLDEGRSETTAIEVKPVS